MSGLLENWFFLLVLLFCVGMHLFGHGHGHEHGSENEHEHRRRFTCGGFFVGLVKSFSHGFHTLAAHTGTTVAHALASLPTWGHVDALREHVRWHQERLHSGECWMLQGQPTDTPRGEQE